MQTHESLCYEHLLTPQKIWNIEQNKPSLVALDLEKFGVPSHITHSVLLARGVYKWLGVRRKLIKLKKTWKDRINISLSRIHSLKKAKDPYKLGYERGYLKAYEECRKEVRALCHSERWQAPDFDKEANQHLNKLSQGAV